MGADGFMVMVPSVLQFADIVLPVLRAKPTTWIKAGFRPSTVVVEKSFQADGIATVTLPLKRYCTTLPIFNRATDRP